MYISIMCILWSLTLRRRLSRIVPNDDDAHAFASSPLQNLEDMAFPKSHNIIDVVKRVCYREFKATA